MRPRSWTEEEVDTLRSLYPSSASFPDLLDLLPSRSPNSIRLMASRLGLKRPTILTGIKKVGETKTSVSAGNGVLVKCSHCSRWIGVSADKTSSMVIVCDHCGVMSLLTE